jgi:hypothetical protein
MDWEILCIVEKPLSTLVVYSLVKLRGSDGDIKLVLIKPKPIDETLPITNKPKHRKKGNTRNKMEGPTSKKTREPSKKVNHKREHQVLNPLLSQEKDQIEKGEDLLKGYLA